MSPSKSSSLQVKQKPTILITGGSGFLGINLIRLLLKKDLTQITSLDLTEFDYPEKSKIKTIIQDIRDTQQIDEIYAKGHFDIIIHAAAALPLYSEQDILSTEIKGTENLLDSAYKHKVKHFIFISSTAVYGVPKKHPIVESDPLVGVGPYGTAKIEAEKICQKYRGKGLLVTILRPKSFVGPERLGVFAMLYDWAHSGRNFPIIGSGTNRYQLLDVEDLSEAIYQIIISTKKLNDNYNVGTDKFTTLKEDFQSVLDEAGFGKKIISLPKTPIIMALQLLEKLKLSPLYPWIYETVSQDSWVSVDKIKKELNFRPKYSNKQALIRNYRWYLKNLNQISKSAGISHRVPWKQGALSLAKLVF